jgi:transposase
MRIEGVARRRRFSLARLSPLYSMTLELSGTLDCCYEHASQTRRPRSSSGDIALVIDPGVVAMGIVLRRCAALDVHKRSVTACLRTPGPEGSRRQQVRSFKTFLDGLEELRDWLATEQVTAVTMESTGSYWKPVWYVLEDLQGVDLKLVNARHVKQVPGRKTDVKDAVWLAELLECGLLAGSFVPPPVIRTLRDLTRYRKRLIQDRTRETQRVDKVLEDAAIKLGSVASKTLGKSGRAMLDALIAGERDPQVLADLARGRLRARIPDLIRALHGRFADHHAIMLREHLDHVDYLDGAIARLDSQIDDTIGPFADQVARLATIPGVATRTAQIIIAEIGVDMEVFPSAEHLASWAGLCPGNNESAGKHFTGRTRKGDQWLTEALVQAAWAAARTKDTYLAARYWQLARRIGKNKAAVAVAHSILVIAYHLLDRGEDYADLGGDYFARRIDPERRTRQLVAKLEQLGHTVTLNQAA